MMASLLYDTDGDADGYGGEQEDTHGYGSVTGYRVSIPYIPYCYIGVVNVCYF